MKTDAADKFEFCRQKAAPPGSSLYYSILYQRQTDKNVLYALHAFHNELTGVLNDCSDPGVAHIKFAWWQEELQRLANGQPRHPVTQALAKTGLPHESLLLLGRIVEHYDKHVDLQQPADYRELIGFLRHGPGAFWQLLANTIGHKHSDTPAIMARLGNQFGYFNVLQEQPRHIQLQRYYYPQDEAREMTDKASLYNLQLHRLEDELASLAEQLPRTDYSSQRHALILARIIAHTCRETRRAGSNLLQQRVSLTPLRKLWIAWCCKLLYR